MSTEGLVVGVSVASAVAGVLVATLVAWRCVVVKRQDKPLPPLALIEPDKAALFIANHKTEWLAADAALFGEAPNWAVRKSVAPDAEGVNLTVREREDPTGNANHLFWYYAETRIPLAASVACSMFATGVSECVFLCFFALLLNCVSLQIPVSRNWTKEIKSTQLLLTCADNSQVWAQYMMPTFLPRFFGVMPRLLMAAYVSTSTDSAAFVSCRSLPISLIDLSPCPSGTPVINWYGAFRLSPLSSSSCAVSKLDREDQGGSFPARLMNATMPKFLAEEVLKATAFISANAAQLTREFDGVPDEGEERSQLHASWDGNKIRF